MKKNSLLVFLLLLPIFCMAQTSVESPKYGFKYAPNVHLTKVECTDSATILYFRTTFKPGTRILIPPKTYIQSSEGGERKYIQQTNGIPMNKQFTMPNSGVVDYSLTFPKIDKSVQRIDYGGEADNDKWKIFDIELKPEESKPIIPKEFTGDWFRKEDGTWFLSMYDTLAIYQEQLWKYGFVRYEKGRGSVLLKNKSKSIELFVECREKDEIMFGNSTKDMTTCSLSPSKRIFKKRPTDKPYVLPVFKCDTAIYSGYIYGYVPRIGEKTLELRVSNILTGNSTLVTTISDDGYFFAKVPLCYPQQVYVSSGIFYSGNVFLEPGKETFQLIGADNKCLFMGVLSQINTDLSRLADLNSFNFAKMSKIILEESSGNYKAYCQDVQKRDLCLLDSLKNLNAIGSKAYQIKRMEIDYWAADKIVDYKSQYIYAYRKKNKLPVTPQSQLIKTDTLPVAYYNFLTDTLINNPLAMMSLEYDRFINHFKFSEIVYGKPVKTSWPQLAIDYRNSGHYMTEPEKRMTDALRKQPYALFYKTNKDTLDPFYAKLDSFRRSLIPKTRYADNLSKNLGLHPGLCSDIMLAQGVIAGITKKLIPVSDTALQTMQKLYTTPFIAEYIATINNQIKARNDEYERKTTVVVNTNPKTTEEVLFDSIMTKYKNKVVFVDFWATWCGPCRAGIENMKPLKAELADSNVVFVYITNQTSPLKDWEKAISTIKGEQYRVSDDDWHFLSGKFNISGIPHYALVGKDGSIINPNLSPMDNEQLKNLLEKYR